MTTTQPEEKLLSQLKQGSPTAVKRWFLEYHQDILRFVLSRVANQADAEEIVQQTFLSCLKHLPFFNGKSTIFTWMLAIAKREVANYFRKKYAKKALQLLPLSECVLVPELASSQEIAQKVATVLKEMRPRQVELLMLKYVDKYRVTYIAGKLGKTAKSIESELLRARNKFKELWSEVV